MRTFTERVMDLVRNREFISVATCDFEGRPNAAPKFVLKIDKDFIYMVDYTIGTTWRNLRVNPRVSLSFMDSKTLTGYQVNGSVTMIDKGTLYKKISSEMLKKQIDLTTKHIIDEVRGKGAQKSFEVIIPKRFVILKVRLEEIVEIKPEGGLKRERFVNFL